jgi:hypothetical protein
MSDGTFEMPPRAERRRKSRRRVLLNGLFVHSDGAQRIACVITELTANGARVEMPIVQDLPASAYLINIRDCIAYQAKIVWNSGTAAALSFSKTFPLTSISNPRLAYLKTVWQESAKR